MEVFYFENVCEGVLNLPEDESKHISRVLRKNVGDCINITDGYGRIFLAEIISTGKHCSVNVKFKELQENKRNYRLHIAIAPTKMMERMEWMIEKTMEIGVDEITPISWRIPSASPLSIVIIFLKLSRLTFTTRAV